jgi:glycosyltransferase involved in cell wall biosynthesis
MLAYADWAYLQRSGFHRRAGNVLLQLQKSKMIGKIILVNNPKFIVNKFLPIICSSNNEISHDDRLLCNEIGHNIILINYWVPLPNHNKRMITYKINAYFTTSLLINKILGIARLYDITSYILWYDNPIYANFIGKLGERLVVFDHSDNYLEHPYYFNIRKEIWKGLNRTLKYADIIFTASQDGRTKLSQFHNRVYWIPNAVDTDIFNPDHIRVSEDLINIPSPIAGYVGVIQSRVDIELLEYCAKKLPHVNFVLIGKVYNRAFLSHLISLPNIYLFEERHSSEIPSYIAGFDVCLIPHKVDDFTRFMDPLKLYEYLAMGKPIVSTPIAGVDRFSDYIYIENSKETFCNSIKDAISKNKRSGVIRKEIEIRHTWEERINKMLEIILENPNIAEVK